MTYADRVPAPRPVPTTRERMTDARAACGHSPEQHRHDDGAEADDRSKDRAIRELEAERDNARTIAQQLITEADAASDALLDAGRTGPGTIAQRIARLAAELDTANQVATFRQGVIDRYRDEIGAAGEVLAVVRDAAEQIDRALARFDTQPEVSPVEPEHAEPHEDPARLRQQLAEAHADCARYATERDEARAALADPLRTAAKDLRLLADQHSIDSLGFGIGWAADRLDDWANTPDEAPNAPLGSVSPRAQDDQHALGRLLHAAERVYAARDTVLPRREALADLAAAADELGGAGEQVLRDRLETAIRDRLSAAWPQFDDRVFMDQVAAVAAVAAVNELRQG